MSPDERGPEGKQDRSVALAVYQTTNRVVHHNPVLRLLRVMPRTLRFVADNLDRRLAGIEGEPAPSLSVGLVGHVAMDEAILALAMGPNRYPRRADYRRVGDELRACYARFEAEGWLADPARYHRDPPPLHSPALVPATTFTSRGSPLLRYEQFFFRSEFEPRPGEVARERWLGYEPNLVGGAWVLEHRDRERPWLVCLHGFGMGFPIMDFGGFDARLLHERLGLNLVFPVLPLHGHRKVTKFSGEAFLSFDLMNTIHGLTQSIWDVRRVLGWVRERTRKPVGVYGVSLGAYVASLLAAIEPELACVIAGIPVVDIPSLFAGHSPRPIHMRAVEYGVLGDAVDAVYRVVSPLAMAPRVPRARRHVFAGHGDRVAMPEQARKLWEHWERPDMLWYPGNHVGYLWSSEVARFVRAALGGSLGVDP